MRVCEFGIGLSDVVAHLCASQGDGRLTPASMDSSSQFSRPDGVETERGRCHGPFTHPGIAACAGAQSGSGDLAMMDAVQILHQGVREAHDGPPQGGIDEVHDTESD